MQCLQNFAFTASSAPFSDLELGRCMLFKALVLMLLGRSIRSRLRFPALLSSVAPTGPVIPVSTRCLLHIFPYVYCVKLACDLPLESIADYRSRPLAILNVVAYRKAVISLSVCVAHLNQVNDTAL